MHISTYMTPVPKTVSGKTEIWKIEEMIKKLGIRHMPVLDENHYGLITDNDVQIVKAFASSHEFLARDFMTQKFIQVKADSILKDVIKDLIDKKLDCAFIFDDKNILIGIFTMIDALKILYDKLE
ncbi:CBS domain-containing protein [Pigmentibacter sp. JX0631]|uniref:CBS domain-containing protein n=1 Tax=Pigmentibacter sp. JX0631 TaxID=2976982 RepID=UPI0024687DED|nr:CBS domain-containing protein [Pigmentibacter sp. JX0631]WGL61014.1 CBS domain-containing protein [Pigmentibacter sp. JX0631]